MGATVSLTVVSFALGFNVFIGILNLPVSPVYAAFSFAIAATLLPLTIGMAVGRAK
jgi:hypothetical protein